MRLGPARSFLLALAFVSGIATPAFADGVGVQGGGGVISISGDIHQFEDPTNSPPSGHGTAAPADPNAGAVLVTEVRLDANGNRCVYVTSTSGSAAAAASAEASLQRLLLTMPICPDSPIKAAPAVTPAAAAAFAWRKDVPLPAPKPNVDPGYAITGKRSFLEAGSPTAFGPFVVNEFGYQITLWATGTYEVVWGDGNQSGPGLASPGGKWPSGDVTHTYDTVGTYRLQVVETWEGRYEINGQRGAITDPITTEGDLVGFEARQVQAVINT